MMVSKWSSRNGFSRRVAGSDGRAKRFRIKDMNRTFEAAKGQFTHEPTDAQRFSTQLLSERSAECSAAGDAG